uniref:TROVE domain-containing protein n=1 Tax=Meloidogyne hapla TaxID=6305 RepID=A0A1I8AYM1_MELHA
MVHVVSDKSDSEKSDILESSEESLRLLDLMVQMSIADVEVPGQQIKIRDDQVRNNAGGYVFKVSDLTRVRRFLILGTDGGTYYITEKKLGMENLDALIDIIRRGKGGMILREIVSISLAGRSPKQDSLLFALALCARYNIRDRKSLLQKSGQYDLEKVLLSNTEDFNSDEMKKFDLYLHKLQQTAFRMVSKVCRIPTHLFMFVKYCELIAKSTGEEHTGWGRAMRKCISEWYLQKSPMELALHITKYPSRESWSHRDLLRLSHPMASLNNKELANSQTLVYDQLFHYACKGDFNPQKSIIVESEGTTEMPLLKKSRCDYELTEQMINYANDSVALEFVRKAMEISKLKSDNEDDEKRCVELIKKYNFVREHVPTGLLSSPKVWTALLQHMPMTALLRNLSKLATLGLLDDELNIDCVDLVISKILNQEALQKARIHPIAVLLASSVYKSGHGIKGKLKWNVNVRVKEALEKCFILAFKNVQPTGQRFCLALDVSGSMSSNINGGVLSCCEASTAMANVTLRTEENVQCVAFTAELVTLPFTRESTITEMMDYTDKLNFGRTDCSLPMTWAKEKHLPFDKIQPFEALKNYRKEMNIPNAKLIVMGMAATEFTIADPNDPGMLDIVGLDAAVPDLIRSFVLEEI